MSGFWLEISDLLQQARDLFEAGDLPGATQAYQAILKINPKYANAWAELSVVAHKQQNVEEAVHCLKQAHACNEDNPHRFAYLVQLADLYRSLSKLDDAVNYYRRALEEAGEVDLEYIYNNLGITLIKQEKYGDAKHVYIEAFKANPKNETTYNNFGIVLEKLRNFPQAIELFRKAIDINPLYSLAHNNLGRVLCLQGNYKEARSVYRHAFKINPRNITAQWGYLLFLPTLYDTQDEIVSNRRRWTRNIKTLIETLPLETKDEIDAALDALLFHVSFYLPYQGGNRIKEMALYGTLVTKIAQAKYPQYSQPLPPRNLKKNEKIRIGFVSAFFFYHSIYKTHSWMLTELDRSKYEIHTFYLNDILDDCVENVRAHSDFFDQRSMDYDGTIRTIAERKLDVIIFLDIGMVPQEQLMAALRLAPLQCMSHGHPITTGLKTVDCFLSSALMEPKGASTQYVEELIMLPNLASSYEYPDLSKAKIPKSFKRKKKESVVFLNAQSLFKLLPQHDDIYPKIALELPNSEFHFIAKHAYEPFYKRLTACFASFGLDVDAYCTFHPALTTNEFFGLVGAADVALDSLEWSGFNSTLETLAANTPVVAMACDTCRGRHSSAILTLMELPELIAKDKDDYIGIAIKLATDPPFRSQVVEKIRKNKRRAFNDPAPSQALDAFLQQRIPRNHSSPNVKA